jgi:hypothetical protein
MCRSGARLSRVMTSRTAAGRAHGQQSVDFRLDALDAEARRGARMSKRSMLAIRRRPHVD